MNVYPRCTHKLREQGVAYPRTCAECGLGPCKLPVLEHFTPQSAQQTERERFEAWARFKAWAKSQDLRPDTWPFAWRSWMAALADQAQPDTAARIEASIPVGAEAYEYASVCVANLRAAVRVLRDGALPLSGEAGWLSTSERLPDQEVPVWTYLDGKIGQYARIDFGDGWLWCNCYDSAYFDGNKWRYGDTISDDGYQPTLWQPLPEPPRYTQTELDVAEQRARDLAAKLRIE